MDGFRVEDGVPVRAFKVVFPSMIVMLTLVYVSDAPGRESRGAAMGNRPREIVVTRDDSSLPDRCRPRRLAIVVLKFLEAMKRGSPAALEPYFGSDFKWFSVTNSPVAGHRKHFVAYKAERAIDYIAERRGFNLKLKEIMVDGAPSMRRSDVAYDGIWTVRRNGVTRRWIFVGKGAINCRSRTVKVWSMSVPEDDTNPGFCPAPAEAVGPRTVIACVSEK